jgi:ribosome-associated protein
LQSDERARRIVAAAVAKKGADPIVLDMSQVTPVADYFVICSAPSRLQVQAIADGVAEALAERPRRSEGYSEARWVCLDYGDVVVHVFQEDSRRYFDLERLWGDVPRLDVDEAVARVAG